MPKVAHFVHAAGSTPRPTNPDSLLAVPIAAAPPLTVPASRPVHARSAKIYRCLIWFFEIKAQPTADPYSLIKSYSHNVQWIREKHAYYVAYAAGRLFLIVRPEQHFHNDAAVRDGMFTDYTANASNWSHPLPCHMTPQSHPACRSPIAARKRVKPPAKAPRAFLLFSVILYIDNKPTEHENFHNDTQHVTWRTVTPRRWNGQ